jgi:hypothetical protein
MMENLLPPPVLEELALTPEQKTNYDALAAGFKKDAAKWRADNNYDPEKSARGNALGARRWRPGNHPEADRPAQRSHGSVQELRRQGARLPF